MESKLTAKREIFLSNVAKAIGQMPSISTEDNIALDNAILKDLVQLENSASSGSISFTEDCDYEGDQYQGVVLIIIEDPMTFDPCLN